MRDALNAAADALDDAIRLLGEAYRIDLWSKSNDASDNHRKRDLLREADWAVARAHRALMNLPELELLANDVTELLRFIEPLADSVTPDMGANGPLDASIDDASTRAAALVDRMRA
jgi:hypothetical protein